jgi:hypothetical protein
MAQIDWTTITTTANAYHQSVSGTAVQHNSISNPITSSGTWFRSFQSSGSNNAAVCGFVPINNSFLTSSLGYSYGFTYSLRAWMRVDNTDGSSGNLRHAASVLSFKNKSNLSAQEWVNAGLGSANTTPNMKGYRIVLRSTNSGDVLPKLYLRCDANESISTANSSLDPANNNNAYEITLLGSPNITNARWLRVRMDVMSLPDADRITVFSGSQAGDWSQLHQVDIQRTKVGAYVPWYNNPLYPSDNTAAATSGYMGFLIYTTQAVTPARIDGFEAYRETVSVS